MEKTIEPKFIRKKILELIVNSGEGHLASCYSVVEMVISIFYDMQKKSKLNLENFVLSKGHSSYAYYAILHEFNLFSNKEFNNVGKYGSKFYGHLPYIPLDNRFQFGSGSLGHGLPYSIGLAKARNLKKDQSTIYCIIGDGESNEGTFWESLLLCQKFNDIKLKILIDCNDSSERAIPIKNILKKLSKAFEEIKVFSCDGHNLKDLDNCLSQETDLSIILCKTIKGFPINFMYGNPIWHHKIPNEDERERIIELL